jgi:hypothetical protein
MKLRKIVLAILLCNSIVTIAQQSKITSVTTAVPFLTISPDSRSSGMGDLGVGTSPDANATFWNAAKLPFYDNGKTNLQYDMGGSLSYVPWLRNIVSDMSIGYLSGFKRLRKEEVIYASFKYFDLGSMDIRDEVGTLEQEVSPYELALTGGYTRQLSEKMAASLGIKWIHSNLTGGVSISQQGQQIETQAANTVGLDLGFFYHDEELLISGQKAELNLGVSVSDIGGKITYTTPENGQNIPTTLRLGGELSTDVDLYNKIGVAVEAKSLLISTASDPENSAFVDFMQKVRYGIGLEYLYANALAIRAGYQYENPDKGSRRYFTLGLGLMYQDFLRFLLFDSHRRGNKSFSQSIEIYAYLQCS